MSTLRYNNRPIGSVTSLGRALGTSARRLYRLAERAPAMYPLARDGIQVKEDGSRKLIYNPMPPLKELQEKMNKVVFHSVSFPAYINGGIKGRSYRGNCLLHTQAKTVVNLDISTFFETVNAAEIKKVWQYFFSFPPEVADLLVRLTTYQEQLPRGAPTSNYLANLVFWDIEPQLEATLRKKGIIYSRYVDDVALSAKRKLTREEVGWAVGQVYGMFFRKGVHPNRVKQRIAYSSRKAVRVHNINVNDVVPTIPKVIRREIRAAVHDLVEDIQQSGFNSDLIARLRHVSGKIAWMKQFHPEYGQSLHEELMLAMKNDSAGNNTLVAEQ